MLGAHLVHDKVPDLLCWGDLVWIFPLQKADGRTIKVRCLREDTDFHWTAADNSVARRTRRTK